jgi:hypothetical protein
MHKNSLPGVIRLLVVIFVVMACNAISDGKPAAEKAIVRFHAMLNDERYTEIYAGLDPKFKGATTEQELTDILQAVHIKLGKVVSSTNQTWRTNSVVVETQILMAQNTDFEEGKAVETFTFVYADKNVSLVGYDINSKELITR